MKGSKIIGGATLILVASAILGCSKTIPEGHTAQAAVSFSIFDALSLPKVVLPREPWLDPLVFFSDKAYLVSDLSRCRSNGILY